MGRPECILSYVFFLEIVPLSSIYLGQKLHLCMRQRQVKNSRSSQVFTVTGKCLEQNWIAAIPILIIVIIIIIIIIIIILLLLLLLLLLMVL